MSNRRRPTKVVPLHPAERVERPAVEPKLDWSDQPPARFQPEVLEWISRNSYTAGRLNAWRCEACGTPFIAVDLHPGVTPMFVPHQAFDPDSDCTGASASGFYTGAAVHAAARQLAYHGHSQYEPTHEWYRPSRDELAELVRAKSKDQVTHVHQGGLLLRPVAA